MTQSRESKQPAAGGGGQWQRTRRKPSLLAYNFPRWLITSDRWRCRIAGETVSQGQGVLLNCPWNSPFAYPLSTPNSGWCGRRLLIFNASQSPLVHFSTSVSWDPICRIPGLPTALKVILWCFLHLASCHSLRLEGFTYLTSDTKLLNVKKKKRGFTLTSHQIYTNHWRRKNTIFGNQCENMKKIMPSVVRSQLKRTLMCSWCRDQSFAGWAGNGIGSL